MNTEKEIMEGTVNLPRGNIILVLKFHYSQDSKSLHAIIIHLFKYPFASLTAFGNSTDCNVEVLGRLQSECSTKPGPSKLLPLAIFHSKTRCTVQQLTQQAVSTL